MRPPWPWLAALLLLASASAPAAQEDIDRPPSSVLLNFREDSWTEVHDGTGARLYFDLGRAGRRVRLEGMAPFELLLGNAGGVDVEFDGEPVPTGQYRAGVVKHLTLEHSSRGRDIEPVEQATTEATDEAETSSAPRLETLSIVMLNFREDSWTEVHDGTGARLYFDLGRAGRRVRLEGTAPFELLLGNAGGVDVEFDGEPVPTGRYRPGVVKLLTLEHPSRDRDIEPLEETTTEATDEATFEATIDAMVEAIIEAMVEVPDEAPVEATDEAMVETEASSAPRSETLSSVVLNFREDSWTEVHDGTGTRLYFDLGRAGRRVRLEGMAPFELLLGNAGGVDVEFDGEPVPTGRYRSGVVKLLTLERPSPDRDIEPVEEITTEATGEAPVEAEASSAPRSEILSSVVLNFREDSWTEVHDGTGTRLYFDLGRAGRRVRLEGTVPFELLLGNAGGVDVAFDGEPVEMSAYSSGDVARLVLAPREAIPNAVAPSSAEASPARMGRSAGLSAKTLDVVGRSALEAHPDGGESKSGGGGAVESGDGADEWHERFPGSDVLAILDRTRDPERWFESGPAAKPTPPDEPEQEAQSYPQFTGFTNFLLEYNTRFRAENSEDEFDDWLAFADSELFWQLDRQWFVSSEIRAVLNGEDDGLHRFNTGFPYEGLYVRELLVERERGRYAVFGGKYDPGASVFGYAPIFFGNYATDFNLEERVGLGASLILNEAETSEHRLSAHAFFLDKSSLSGELFRAGARNGIISGQVGDTGTLNNFLITLNGGSTDWNPGWRYTLGAATQTSNEPDVLNENARLGSLFHINRLESGADLEFSLDLLELENAGGYSEDTQSFTLGLAYSKWPFLLGAAYSERAIRAQDRVDRIFELVYRKGVAESTYLELAYQRVNEDGEEEESLGAVLIYSLDWRGN